MALNPHPRNSLGGEAKQMVQRITENCELLTQGWREKVEYTVPVKYHRTAPPCGNPDDCHCPITHEKRVRHVKRPGLIDQLKEYAANRDTDRNPKAERGAPRIKKGSSTNPELDGFFTLDEIAAEAYMLFDRVLDECGRDRAFASQPLKQLLGESQIVYQMIMIADTHPDHVREVVNTTDKWVTAAKRALRMTVADAMLEGTVCGNCDGGLAVPWDNGGDVRCVGSPATPPCGERYPMSEWVGLYERGRK